MPLRLRFQLVKSRYRKLDGQSPLPPPPRCWAQLAAQLPSSGGKSVYHAMSPCTGKERPMLIHSMLPRSTVNGPGARAVVWLQGCGLRCPGCFNPATHSFDRDRDKTVEEVAERVLACEGIEGVTFSGGEPFQQAGDLRRLCEYIKFRRPD